MPYINDESKLKFEPELQNLLRLIPEIKKKGELTYLVYALGITYFKGRISYTNISDAISALNDAAQEIRRRHLDAYEDGKIIENGDVSQESLERQVEVIEDGIFKTKLRYKK